MDIKKYEADIADVAAHEVEAYRAIESRRFDQATAHAALATAIASRAALEAMRPVELTVGRVDERIVDSVSADRQQLRRALLAHGYDRTGSTTDAGDGAYAEYWSGPLGIVRVDWKARS